MGVFVYVIKYNFKIIFYASAFGAHILIKSSYTFAMREHIYSNVVIEILVVFVIFYFQ